VTAVAPASRHDAGLRRGARRRIGRLLRTEALLLWRFDVVAAAVVVTGLWSVVLRLVDPAVRAAVVPAVLLTDVTALSFLFVPALLVLERIEQVDAALRMTPVRTAERVGVRVGLTTGLAAAAAAGVCVAVGIGQVGPRLLGVALLSMLFGLLAFALTGGATTLTAFLLRAPLVAAPLIAPALAHLLRMTDAPVLHVSPVTAAVDLLRGDVHALGVAWLALWIGGVALVVDHVARRPAPADTGAAPAVHGRARRAAAWPAHPGAWTVPLAIRSFLRADRRTLVRDGLLVLLVASVPLLALAMRALATVGQDWVQQRYGVSPEPYLPLIEVLLLVAHTPVVLGSLTGLLLLEDRDAGLFGPLAATRAGLGTLLAYRLGVTAACTTVALALCLPLDGVAHAAGAAGVLATAVAAGAVSVVPALLMAATARNRVQGVAVMKMLGLPLYLPLATWQLDGPARWVFAALPTSWAMWASWASTAAGAAVAAGGAVAVSAACAVPLRRRVLRRARAF